jgi:carbonic anhydrase/acetyltransferase-like protein (isoleucine patch superfamily)
MQKLERLIERIIDKVNMNLREHAFDVAPLVRTLIPGKQLLKFYGFYGLSPHYPLDFHFHHSNLAGSYLLGRCWVDHSVLYKSDIRGDELKHRGDTYLHEDKLLTIMEDELIRIRDSFLIKTLVHCFSHDPENLEEMPVRNTVAMHFSNIHGSPMYGAYLGPFATVDLTTIHDCVIGDFAYVQTGELRHHVVPPGHVWVCKAGVFEFRYQYPAEILTRYIVHTPGYAPRGLFMVLADQLKDHFQEAFSFVHSNPPKNLPCGASVSPYAVLGGNTEIGENVLVAQRAYLSDARMGSGSNAQENCFIISSDLRGLDITAHGANVIHSHLGQKVFVGFNSFIKGCYAHPLKIGKGSIVMPHTIIDTECGLEIPPDHLVWGYIGAEKDLATQTIPLAKLAEVKDHLRLGEMVFHGDGEAFVSGFQQRIGSILAANGAYFDGRKETRGHAQKGQDISFNIIQPYPKGAYKGLYPTLDIRPPSSQSLT